MTTTSLPVGTQVRIVGHYPPLLGTVVAPPISTHPLALVDIPGWGRHWYGPELLKPRKTR